MRGGRRMRARRILFFAETVTLAHLARPIALARGLAGSAFEPFIACDARYQHFLRGEAATPLPLTSISSARFLQALARGSPVYDLPTLRDYVRADMALIDQVRPDLIVGDFRLSLSVSARLAGIPYAAITNAYWSPRYQVKSFPQPVLPMTRFLPVPVARRMFNLARPLAFALHCKPMNRLRTEHGLPALGNDLRRVYTDADFTLYADDPVLFPLGELPPTHRFLGPVLWSPPIARPRAWDALDASRPTVYLTMGSSGDVTVARTLYQALVGLDVNVIAATAGAELGPPQPAHACLSEYVPGEAAAAISQLVICNGGSPTSQQALAAGVPVLGIAGNMDQFLNMEGLVRGGVGVLLRADRLKQRRVREAVRRMLADDDLRRRARERSTLGATESAPQQFLNFATTFLR